MAGDRVHREEEGARPEVLFELTDEQMAEVGSPVGTSVLYHFRGGTSADGLAGGRAIVAREGVVMSASMSIHKSIVYQVERVRSAACDGHHPIVDTVAENALAYAIGCPVILKTSNGEGRIEGRVLFAKPVNENSGKSSIEYTVQWTTEAGLLRMEEGVSRDRLSYNANAAEQRNTSPDANCSAKVSSPMKEPSEKPAEEEELQSMVEPEEEGNLCEMKDWDYWCTAAGKKELQSIIDRWLEHGRHLPNADFKAYAAKHGIARSTLQRYVCNDEKKRKRVDDIKPCYILSPATMESFCAQMAYECPGMDKCYVKNKLKLLVPGKKARFYDNQWYTRILPRMTTLVEASALAADATATV